MADKSKIDAEHILSLLADKHRKDVFVSECKDGPTIFGRHLRLDAWAMARSWAKPRTVGYEIKTSRADFLGDTKWQGYLEFCNELYFVCLPGVIKKDELPEPVGYLEVARTGSRLWTRKKAPYREVEVPESLYRYILMSRARIYDPHEFLYSNPPPDRAYWEEWLKKKDDNLRFGRAVGKRLRELISKKITEVECKQHQFEKQIEEYEDVRQFLADAGIKDGLWFKNAVERRVKMLEGSIPRGLTMSITSMRRDLDRFEKALESISGVSSG